MRRIVRAFSKTRSALCSGVVVAFTSWLAVDSSDGVRALAAVAGLGVALALMLFVAWALASDEPSEAAAAPRAGAAPAWPTAPDRAFARPVKATAAAPPSQVARETLTQRLAEGRALREALDPGTADARVSAWVDGARHTIEQHKPGVVGYFNALSSRTYADDGDRLDAHIGRLATIVRDFLPAELTSL